MRENPIATVLGAVVGVLLALAFIWPGWAFGHPIWGPWGTTTQPPTGPVAGAATPISSAPAATPAAAPPVVDPTCPQGYVFRDQACRPPIVGAPDKPAPPAAAPAAPAPPKPSAPGPAPVVGCPTDGEMQRLHGWTAKEVLPRYIEGVAWEPCLWVWQSNNVAGTPLPLLRGWQYTVTRRADDVVAVYYGDGTTLQVKGFSARLVGIYASLPDGNDTRGPVHWVLVPCRLLEEESGYGQRRRPSYPTVPGNVKCDAGNFYARVALANGSPPAAPPGPAAPAGQAGGLLSEDDPRCPKTREEAARLMKGEPSQWENGAERPGYSEKFTKWLFDTKSSTKLVTVTYPGFGYFDVWNQPNVKVTKDVPNIQALTFNCAK